MAQNCVYKEKGLIMFKWKNKELAEADLLQTEFIYNIIILGNLVEGGDQILLIGSFLLIHDGQGWLLMKVKWSPNRLYKIILEYVR